MPHFIQRDIMEELQQRFPREWEVTSTHRFRSSKDMQFGFGKYVGALVDSSKQARCKLARAAEYVTQRREGDIEWRVSIRF
jgi:hypothetical protein